MPSGRTKKVCGGPLICSAARSTTSGSASCGYVQVDSCANSIARSGRGSSWSIPMIMQVGLVCRCHLGEVGRFLPAGFAPLRPDIDHHRLAAKPGEPHLHGRRRGRATRRRAVRTAPPRPSGRTRGQSAMPAAFFMAARSAVDSGLGSGLGWRLDRRARPGEHRRPAATSQHDHEHGDCRCQPASVPIIIPAAPEPAWQP